MKRLHSSKFRKKSNLKATMKTVEHQYLWAKYAKLYPNICFHYNVKKVTSLFIVDNALGFQRLQKHLNGHFCRKLQFVIWSYKWKIRRRIQKAILFYISNMKKYYLKKGKQFIVTLHVFYCFLTIYSYLKHFDRWYLSEHLYVLLKYVKIQWIFMWSKDIAHFFKLYFIFLPLQIVKKKKHSVALVLEKFYKYLCEYKHLIHSNEFQCLAQGSEVVSHIFNFFFLFFFFHLFFSQFSCRTLPETSMTLLLRSFSLK